MSDGPGPASAWRSPPPLFRFVTMIDITPCDLLRFKCRIVEGAFRFGGLRAVESVLKRNNRREFMYAQLGRTPGSARGIGRWRIGVYTSK